MLIGAPSEEKHIMDTATVTAEGLQEPLVVGTKVGFLSQEKQLSLIDLLDENASGLNGRGVERAIRISRCSNSF
jgi:hypothetical protein